jgi:hypothetical protein
MHRPPAVAWDLGPTLWQNRILTGLALLASLVSLGFLVEQGWGLSSFILLVALLVGCLLAAMARHNAHQGQLRWDGEQWHWIGAQGVALRTMVCMVDLQVTLLLQVTSDQGKRHWFWLDSGDKPAQWRAMRRAIVASTSVSHDGISAEPIDG